MTLEEYQAALADFSRALKLDSELAQAYFNRGFLYKLQGQMTKASEDLERFQELTDNPKWIQIVKQQLSVIKEHITRDNDPEKEIHQ